MLMMVVVVLVADGFCKEDAVADAEFRTFLVGGRSDDDMILFDGLYCLLCYIYEYIRLRV
jgi:hypothetical protein